MYVTLRQIAEAAGVHVETVKKDLRNPDARKDLSPQRFYGYRGWKVSIGRANTYLSKRWPGKQIPTE